MVSLFYNEPSYNKNQIILRYDIKLYRIINYYIILNFYISESNMQRNIFHHRRIVSNLSVQQFLELMFKTV